MYDPASVPLPASMSETFAGKPDVQRHYSVSDSSGWALVQSSACRSTVVSTQSARPP